MSDNDDPFSAFGADHTIIKPSAGRGRAPAPAAPAAPAPAPAPAAAGEPASPPAREVPMALDALMSASLNPLVSAAAPLLTAAPRIRVTARHPNPSALREALAEGIRKFESQARAQGLPNDQVIATRYILCTMLDEAAALTPWGGSGVWSAQSLLVQFHNETWGGEKVFQLLGRLAENVQANRNLLELLYVVLAFGFEGRYRVIDGGRAQLDSVRERLFQMLQQQAPKTDPELSPRWAGVARKPSRLVDGVPQWVIGSVLLLLLTVVWGGMRLRLGAQAQPVFQSLASIQAPVASNLPPPPPPPPAPRPRLAVLLAPQIQQGLIQVADYADRSVVTIHGDGFFESGSADIAPAVRSLLPAIGHALAEVPGRIEIAGNTDNQPIHTLRYPSNYVLSKDRADSVRDVLARYVEPSRMQAEGLGDSQPVASNATPAGRAKNRRVVITLYVPTQARANAPQAARQ